MWTRVWNKLRSLHRDETFARDLAEELDFHREMLERDCARDGVSSDGSAIDARRRMGNVTIAKEDARLAWTFDWLAPLARDARIAVRGYRRSPGFAMAAVLVIALGLGANMAVFRFVDAAIFETLPVARPHELVRVGGRVYSYPAFQEVAGGTQDVLSHVAAWSRTRANLTLAGRAEYVSVDLVSGSYFHTLGVRPALGRLLTVEDDGAEGAHRVCVIGYGLWQRLFAGALDIVGTTVLLQDESFQIVGVAERGFEGGALHQRSDVHVPLSMVQALGGDVRDTPGVRSLQVIGRLAPGVSRQQAEGVIRARYQDLESPRPGTPLAVTDGRQGFGSARATLLDSVLVAQALSLCVLLTACTSLTGLLLARVSARRHEIALRLALGASRRQVVAQLAVEAAGLVAAGAVLACCVAVVLDGELLKMLGGPESTLHIGATPSRIGLVALLIVSMLTVIGVGLLPALSATRKLPVNALRESGRAGGAVSRLAAPLITAQVAGCLVLVFGAILLGRTLYNLRSLDLGLDPEHVVVVTASPSHASYSRERRMAFYDEWLRRVERTPGVTSAGLAVITAMTESMFALRLDVPDAVVNDTAPNNNVNIVSPDYFRTIGLPIVEGRSFTAADTAQSNLVAIVNQRFVDHYWPARSPIGRQFSLPRGPVTVVGVVPTAKYGTVREEPQVVFYLPFAQQGAMVGEATLHARVDGDTAEVAAALARSARELDPAIPIHSAGALSGHVEARLANERVLNVVGLLFGTLALLVSAAGLYGSVAYAVARRTREIGIRTAIGAQRLDIIRLFTSRTLWSIASGIAMGAPMALTAGRSLGGVLYGVAPSSTSALAAAVLLLAVVAATAAIIPALRAAKVDPVRALRAE
jgi:predicted permease